MASIFSKIADREIPGHIVAENDHFIAFLDINPLVEGHTLVVPKEETDYIFDLPDQSLADLHVFSKKVAKALKRVIPCDRIGVSVIGLEVPHAHIHLIPISSMADMDFGRMKLTPSKDELSKVAALIKSAFELS